jgi:hypothetical protein
MSCKSVDYFLLGLRFLRSKSENYMYWKQDGGNFLFRTLYVDDMLFFNQIKDQIHDMNSKVCDMNDLGYKI